MTMEASQAAFTQVMGYNPSFYTACGDDCPAHNVSWHEAAAFANALSATAGLEDCYSCTGTGDSSVCTDLFAEAIYECTGYRLPTEAEWEYAARAGDTGDYATGAEAELPAGTDGSGTDWTSSCDGSLELTDGTLLTDVAWYCGNNSPEGPKASGGTAANAFGIYDMHGNVREWMQDLYTVAYPASTEDPVGTSGSENVYRDGSYGSFPSELDLGHRNSSLPTAAFSGYGFRLVRTLGLEEAADGDGDDDGEVLDWAQVYPATSPAPRALCQMIFDTTIGSIVMFGGPPWETLSDTWLWDGVNWTEVETTDSPPNSVGFVMDSSAGVGILFDGDQGTWIWEGETLSWTEIFPATTPSSRSEPTMSFDPVGGGVILDSGGCGGGSSCFREDTLAFSVADSDWSVVSDSGPTPVEGPACASGDASMGVVRFGGNTYGGLKIDETWIWDGASWGQASTNNAPEGRQGGVMAYHAGLESIVLYGGWDNNTSDPYYYDTWAWDGEEWEEITPETTPSSYFRSCMAYDPVHEQLVMFGGSSQSGNIDETWILDAQ
jgi:formylglycine-generating enzyme required for sulfatase activity